MKVTRWGMVRVNLSEAAEAWRECRGSLMGAARWAFHLGATADYDADYDPASDLCECEQDFGVMLLSCDQRNCRHAP